MKKTLFLGFALAACMLAGAALASPPPDTGQSYRTSTVVKQEQAAPAVAATSVAVADFAAAPASISGAGALATVADKGKFHLTAWPSRHVVAAPGFRARVDRLRVSWT